MGKKHKFAMVPPQQFSPPPFMSDQGIGFFSMLHKTWRMGNLQSVIESQIALQATRDAQMLQPYETSVQMAELQAKFLTFHEQVKQQKWLTRGIKADVKTKQLKNVQLLLDNKKAKFEFQQLTAGTPEDEE